jgi:multicomponent Na+:H+ antiporter subunit A
MILTLLTSWTAALLAPLLQRLLPRAAGWLCGLLPLTLCVYFMGQIKPVSSGELLQQSFAWIPSLGITFTLRLDGLSLLFALLISGIGALVVIYASSYLHGHRHLGRFYGLILAFMAAMLGTVLAGDLITLFIFWELTGICSFLLIGFDHSQEASRRAALQALLVTGAGGLALLAGVILIGQAAGSLELATVLASGELLRGHPLYLPILLLVLAGAFTKSAQFPFHFWLPGAMAAPTPVSAYLHSATMVKLGIYLLARLSPALGGNEEWFFCLALTGGITMLLGGMIALLHNDLKQILAWSTVAALGTLTLLLGLSSPMAVTAAMLLLPVHALYKSALFLSAGAVDHGTGSRDISRLGGLARSMPWVAAAAGLAALSMAGLPPLAGFIAKELFYETTLQMQTLATPATVVAILGSALTVAAALLAGYLPFFGTEGHPTPELHRLAPRLWLPALLPALAGLLAGLFPGQFGRWLVAPAAASVYGGPLPVELALWHGINPVLFLSLATLGAGLALTLLRRPLLKLLPTAGNCCGWWGPERLYALLLTSLTTTAARVTAVLQSGRLRYYLMAVIGVTVCLIASTLATNFTLPSRLPLPDGGLHEWLTAAVILAGALMATITTSRLAAVAALGTVGYGVALIYIIFGAPDLAMTQFCIETLSIILFVLVLHKLPRFTLLSSPGSRFRDLLVALSIGGIMTTLALLAIAQPMTPQISSWFLEQSLPLGHGRNVVNVILVDFRALDTLGEITVLAIAALGVYGLLKPRSGEGA